MYANLPPSVSFCLHHLGVLSGIQAFIERLAIQSQFYSKLFEIIFIEGSLVFSTMVSK